MGVRSAHRSRLISIKMAYSSDSLLNMRNLVIAALFALFAYETVELPSSEKIEAILDATEYLSDDAPSASKSDTDSWHDEVWNNYESAYGTESVLDPFSKQLDSNIVNQNISHTIQSEQESASNAVTRCELAGNAKASGVHLSSADRASVALAMQRHFPHVKIRTIGNILSAGLRTLTEQQGQDLLDKDLTVSGPIFTLLHSAGNRKMTEARKTKKAQKREAMKKMWRLYSNRDCLVSYADNSMHKGST